MFSSTNLSFDSIFAVTMTTAAIVAAKESQSDKQKVMENHYVPRRLENLNSNLAVNTATDRDDLMASLGVDNTEEHIEVNNEALFRLKNQKIRGSKDDVKQHDEHQPNLDAGVLSSPEKEPRGKKENRTKRHLKVGKAKPSKPKSIKCSKSEQTSVDVIVQHDDYPQEMFWTIDDMYGELVDFGTGFFFGYEYKQVTTSVGGLCAGNPYVFQVRDTFGDGFCWGKDTFCPPGFYIAAVQGENELGRVEGFFAEESFEFTPSVEFSTPAPTAAGSSSTSYSATAVPSRSCDSASLEVVIKTGDNPPKVLWYGLDNEDNSLFVRSGVYDLQANSEITRKVDGACRGDLIWIKVCNGIGDPLGDGFSFSVNFDDDQLWHTGLEGLKTCLYYVPPQ